MLLRTIFLKQKIHVFNFTRRFSHGDVFKPHKNRTEKKMLESVGGVVPVDLIDYWLERDLKSGMIDEESLESHFGKGTTPSDECISALMRIVMNKTSFDSEMTESCVDIVADNIKYFDPLDSGVILALFSKIGYDAKRRSTLFARLVSQCIVKSSPSSSDMRFNYPITSQGMAASLGLQACVNYYHVLSHQSPSTSLLSDSSPIFDFESVVVKLAHQLSSSSSVLSLKDNCRAALSLSKLYTEHNMVHQTVNSLRALQKVIIVSDALPSISLVSDGESLVAARMKAVIGNDINSIHKIAHAQEYAIQQTIERTSSAVDKMKKQTNTGSISIAKQNSLNQFGGDFNSNKTANSHPEEVGGWSQENLCMASRAFLRLACPLLLPPSRSGKATERQAPQNLFSEDDECDGAKLMRLLAKVAMFQRASLDPSAIALLSNAFAHVLVKYKKVGSSQNLQSSPFAPLFEMFADEASRCLRTTNSSLQQGTSQIIIVPGGGETSSGRMAARSLATIASSFAQVGLLHEDFIRHLSASTIASCDKWDAQTVAMIASSFVNLSLTSDIALDALWARAIEIVPSLNGWGELTALVHATTKSGTHSIELVKALIARSCELIKVAQARERRQRRKSMDRRDGETILPSPEIAVTLLYALVKGGVASISYELLSHLAEFLLIALTNGDLNATAVANSCEVLAEVVVDAREAREKKNLLQRDIHDKMISSAEEYLMQVALLVQSESESQLKTTWLYQLKATQTCKIVCAMAAAQTPGAPEVSAALIAKSLDSLNSLTFLPLSKMMNACIFMKMDGQSDIVSVLSERMLRLSKERKRKQNFGEI